METIKAYLTSQEFFLNIIFLILGGIVGVQYSLRANKPKLIISGGGGGGNPDLYTWRINIVNRPSFFGQVLDGEDARDLRAHIRADKSNSRSYSIFWGYEKNYQTTIKPGQQQSLELFHWKEGVDGYLIVDNKGEYLAKFTNSEQKFILTIVDTLERRTDFRLLVEFDNTLLNKTPSMQIIEPVTIYARLARAKEGIKIFLSAFRPQKQ